MFGTGDAPPANSVRHIRANAPDQHSDNKISNTKYSAASILPMVFLQQMRSPSSAYFFCIMILQWFKALAITSFTASLVPWLFVLVISLFNEGLDDWARHRRDKESNSGRVKVWRRGEMTEKTSADLKTGDVIMVNKGDRIPADCVILKVEDQTGEIFIRTDQLDGETDWKRRLALPEVQYCPLEAMADIAVIAEHPHKDIYNFAGTVSIRSVKMASDLKMNSFLFKEQQMPAVLAALDDDGTGAERLSLPLNLENTLWANTVAATCAALCIVVYAGNDTRSMMNTYKPRSKLGKIDKELDSFVTLLGISSIIAAVVFTLLGVTTFSYRLIFTLLRFLLIFSYVIPISLKVSINMARFYYGFIAQKSIVGAKVRTSTLQEELGRISFFLTDKTGTLTKNEMIMKKIHLGTICYASDHAEEIKSAISRALDKKSSPSKRKESSGFRKAKNLNFRAYELCEALSLCHSVTPVVDDDVVTYQASSPDEVAIVNFAERVGLALLQRDRFKMTIGTSAGKCVYRLLHVFPFNSDTKRMGVLVAREDENGQADNSEICLFMKGADTVMRSILKETDWADEETYNMARDGLRTLLFGKRIIPAEEYAVFTERYNQAKLSLSDRNSQMLAVQESLERDLELLGITGVEDLLQDRVKPTLENLRNAGLKIWMLTGDKIETAISIALSSRLLNKTDRFFVISNCTTESELRRSLNTFVSRRFNALIIDGVSIGVVIDSCLREFVDIAKDLACVVGCRYSPTQKAIMAAALKTMAGETVCCIGDGGNDVSMITEADVGVGIEGKEGKHAALAADFSIKNFADISDVLFWHGRRCYTNSSNIANSIIQRGVIVSAVQGIFCALIHFFPISIFQGWMLPIFMSVTFFPMLVYALAEDISKAAALKFPELYKERRDANLLSYRNLFITVIDGFFQASIIMLFFFYIKAELSSLSVLVFSCMVFTEQLRIFVTVERINVVVLLVCAGSICCFLLSTLIFDEFNIAEPMDLKSALKIVGISMLSMSSQLIARIYNRWYRPAAHFKLAASVQDRATPTQTN